MCTKILIYGTGSLAHATCNALSLIASKPLHVYVAGRQKNLADKIAAIFNIRSKIAHTPIKFFGQEVNWQSYQLLKNQLTSITPDLIFHTASLQSPWELQFTNAWTDLIKKGGFGITLPLQALLPVKIATLIKKLKLPTLLINACYPDAVNALIRSLDLNVTCGVGNVAIIYAALSTKLINFQQEKLKILAHHYHLTEKGYQNSIRAWSGDKEIIIKPKTLTELSKINDKDLNHVTGLTAAQLCLAILNHYSTIALHAPGPNGLPGGYPITVHKQKVKLNLPASLTLFDAVRWNQQQAKHDGVVVKANGKIKFSTAARMLLKKYKFAFSAGFCSEELSLACNALDKLRIRLRHN